MNLRIFLQGELKLVGFDPDLVERVRSRLEFLLETV